MIRMRPMPRERIARRPRKRISRVALLRRARAIQDFVSAIVDELEPVTGALLTEAGEPILTEAGEQILV